MFFVFITGFEASVLRAVIMATVVLIGKILQREPDIFTSIALSALLILLFSPYTLFDVGFVLTYAATISLILFYRNIKALITCSFLPGKAADALAVTLAAETGVMPVILVYFNKISLVSVFSNLLVAPTLETVTILGMLMAVLGQVNIVLSQLIGYANCLLLSFILFVVKVSAGLPYSVVKIPTPPLLPVILYYLAAWFFLWYKPKMKIKLNYRYAAAVLALVCLIAAAGFLAPRNLKVTFLDVGEGDSAFIRTCTEDRPD